MDEIHRDRVNRDRIEIDIRPTRSIASMRRVCNFFRLSCHLSMAKFRGGKDLTLATHSISRNCLRHTRRASVAIWIAAMAPGLIMAISMGIEVGSWAYTQVSVQRSADLAAMAGAINYQSTTNKQAAATFAARMAQLNGGSGTASPTWNSGSNTLTDNQITAQVVSGWQTSSDTAIKVTMQKTVASMLSYPLFSSSPSHTITASGTAELITTGGAGSGAQPCLLALSTSGTVSGTGSTYWTMPNCGVRSNGTVDVHGGGGPLTTAGIYAGGAVNIDTWITTTGGQYPNSGTIPDPYASNTALQNLFTSTAALTGVTNISCGTTGGVVGTAGQYTGDNNCNGTNTLPNGGTCVTGGGVTCTMKPGNYGAWLVPQGGPYTFNLQPGLYLFNGPILLSQNTTTNGTAVTIITVGGTYSGTAYSFTGSNSFNFNVTAPTPSDVLNTGGIAGIVLASNSSTTVTISGNAAFNIEGVAYFPNAIFDASGSSCNSSSPCFGTNNGTACLEIIASSIKTTGNSNFNSNCTAYGAATFTSLPGTTTMSARVVH